MAQRKQYVQNQTTIPNVYVNPEHVIICCLRGIVSCWSTELWYNNQSSVKNFVREPNTFKREAFHNHGSTVFASTIKSQINQQVALQCKICTFYSWTHNRNKTLALK